MPPTRTKLQQRILRTIDHLSNCQVEISTEHLYHVNNKVPHFHPTVRGSWDAFPVWVYQAPNRYQPKYERSVVKYNVIVAHTGHIAFISGGHLRAMSDTTLAVYTGQHLQGLTHYLLTLLISVFQTLLFPSKMTMVG